MKTDQSREEVAETVAGVAGVLTAGGVLTFALFPLLLPTVVLLAALALPLVPLLLLGGIAALAVSLVRRLLSALAREPGRRERTRRSPRTRSPRLPEATGALPPRG